MKMFTFRQTHLQVGVVLLILCNTRCCTSAFTSAPNNLALVPRQSRSHNARIPTAHDIHHHSHDIVSNTCSSRRTASSALSAVPISPSKLATVGAGIAKFYKTSPLLAGFLTCSTKAAFADSLAQYRDVCTTKFNCKRNIAMVLYSGIILGISCEIMYNRIYPFLFGAEQTFAVAIKKVLFDGFVTAPTFWLPPAYIAQALVYRYPIRDAMQKYITDIKENGLLKKYWSLWIPVSTINFLYMPPHFRIAFVAAVSFFWMIILSVVANKEQDPDSCPLEPEPAMMNPRALD
mmetsp:Transcript_10008/g.15014  ORF Transcript_10008/g.15014 Transcript_10008/m.15014 type:complete len:290 (+) Transcript_10008:83-952(+)